jgi:hypothetical protein
MLGKNYSPKFITLYWFPLISSLIIYLNLIIYLHSLILMSSSLIVFNSAHLPMDQKYMFRSRYEAIYSLWTKWTSELVFPLFHHHLVYFSRWQILASFLRSYIHLVKKFYGRPGMVTHACNVRYSVGRDRSFMLQGQPMQKNYWNSTICIYFTTIMMKKL